jgi:all-trans-retinol 13,14-reductase
LVAAIDENGGNCLANARVSEILLDDAGKRATGVRVQCAGGKTVDLKCKRGVVSAAGFVNTYTKLLPLSKHRCKALPQWFCDAADKLMSGPSSTSAQHFQVFLGLNKSSEELKLPQYNTWFLLCDDAAEWDYDTFLKRFHDDPFNAPMLAFVGFPSAKDPSYSKDYATCTIVTEVPFGVFEQWGDREVKARGTEYETRKKMIGDRLIDLVCKEWPQLAAAIEKVDMGTPVTAQYYLNSQRGESYGLQCTTERNYDFDICHALKAKQPIDGLWLSGQDVMTPGFAGAFNGGVLCAGMILGYDRLPCLVAGRSLIRDLRKMDGFES